MAVEKVEKRVEKTVVEKVETMAVKWVPYLVEKKAVRSVYLKAVLKVGEMVSSTAVS